MNSDAQSESGPGGYHRGDEPGRKRFRRPQLAAVGGMLGVAAGVVTLATGVLDLKRKASGPGPPIVPQETLAEYRVQVGKICEDLNAVQESTVRRAGGYGRRLRRASDLQGLRDVIVEEVQQRIGTSSSLRARSAGLDPPSDRLRATQDRTVRLWDRNIAQLQSQRDRLKGARSYPQLLRLVTGFDSERTAIERTGADVREGLQRLGGRDCELEVPPASKPVPFPPDPARAGLGSAGGSVPGRPSRRAGSGTTADVNPPGLKRAPGPDVNPTAPDASPPPASTQPPPASAEPSPRDGPSP